MIETPVVQQEDVSSNISVVSSIVSDMGIIEEEDDVEEFSDEIVEPEDCLDFVDEPVPQIKDVKESAKELLMSLISKDASLFKDAVKMMDKAENKKRSTDHTKAKQYRYCTVLTTCTHCGVTSERTVTLETKSDSFVYIGDHDKVTVVTFQTIETPCTFIAKTQFCGSCYDYIKMMSRDELEERYIKLLKEDL